MTKRLSRIDQVSRARKRVQKLISLFASQGEPGSQQRKFASGLATESYKGGYRDALDDVTLLLNGVTPNRNGWWEDEWWNDDEENVPGGCESS